MKIIDLFNQLYCIYEKIILSLCIEIKQKISTIVDCIEILKQNGYEML